MRGETVNQKCQLQSEILVQDFKVMEAKNKKMWKYWFVDLRVCLFVCRKWEGNSELTRRGGKEQLID